MCLPRQSGKHLLRHRLCQGVHICGNDLLGLHLGFLGFRVDFPHCALDHVNNGLGDQFAEFGIKCWQLSWTNGYHNPKAKVHDQALEYLKQGYYLIGWMVYGLLIPFRAAMVFQSTPVLAPMADRLSPAFTV